MPRKHTINSEDSFSSKVEFGDTVNDCWIWTGAMSGRCPVMFVYKTGICSVKRYIFNLHKGEDVPRNKNIIRKCGNARCVNPEHMEVVGIGCKTPG